MRELVGAGTADDEILPPERAFPLSVAPDASGVGLTWDIQDGYYLYREKFSFAVVEGDAVVDAAALSLPRGAFKEDEAFGRVEVHFSPLTVEVPVIRNHAGELPLRLRVGYQGCKDGSVCYPPQVQELDVTLPPSPVAAGTVRSAGGTAHPATWGTLAGLNGAGLMANLIAFFSFGILLSLTPCIFPMVPILSGIILGGGEHVTHVRGFLLSLVYVVAMAATYAALGVFAGLTRFNLQAAAQAPWAMVLFSAVFLLLALSMFGLFRLQMPVRVQSWIAAITSHQHAGTFRGTAVMGVLSALLVGPCVAPPLAAALLYITQTGDALLGGSALFALGLGMGAPLLVLGLSAGYLLPRAGYWMESVRQACGLIMIGVAIWFLGRVLPGPVTLLLWGVLFLVAANFLGALDRLDGAMPWRRVGQALGFAFLVYGSTLVVGAASGGDDPLRPLASLADSGTAAAAQPARLPFKRVSSLAGLQTELEHARAEGRAVMLDFYADWCITCKDLERETFPDPRVRARLTDVVLLQADVTAYNSADRQLLNEFGLYGPPAILFFDVQARELRHRRLGGFLDADDFVAHLAGAVSS
ncbi:MAG: protein-disulfide reductase DsbD [Gammaproteobacteria bacterium]|nr:protein-disulfide reductase DsbD [Gammaproteobacteria bacterium]